MEREDLHPRRLPTVLLEQGRQGLAWVGQGEQLSFQPIHLRNPGGPSFPINPRFAPHVDPGLRQGLP